MMSFNNQTIQFPVEKQKINKHLFSSNFNPILVAHKYKVCSETNNKITDILDDFCFNHTLINILIRFSKILDIDKIKKIVFPECFGRLYCILGVRECTVKIVRQRCPVLVQSRFDIITQGIFAPDDLITAAREYTSAFPLSHQYHIHAQSSGAIGIFT